MIFNAPFDLELAGRWPSRGLNVAVIQEEGGASRAISAKYRAPVSNMSSLKSYVALCRGIPPSLPVSPLPMKMKLPVRIEIMLGLRHFRSRHAHQRAVRAAVYRSACMPPAPFPRPCPGG